MKKKLSIMLATILCLSLAACGSSGNNTSSDGGSTATTDSSTSTSTTTTTTDTTDPEPASDDSDFSGAVTLDVMLMPQGDMNSATVAAVTDAINARIAELGYEFSISFSFSGGAWGFDDLNLAHQTGSAPDIFPAHTWSGNVTYATGARTGQLLRLDDPTNNLLEKYGPALYGNTASAIRDAAIVSGDQGRGIYGYIPEKDSVSQLGYLVNQTVLEELGFSLSDFVADDLASWEPILQAFKEAHPGEYPLNIEAEVLDRTVNHVMYVNNPIGPMGVVFNNSNPGGTNVAITSRYENPKYLDFIATMHNYYEAGYVDPDQGIVGEISSGSVANRRETGDYLIATIVYAPGHENTMSAAATAAQGRDITIAWVPGWSTSIATVESATGSGLAVSAGTKYAAEAVTFLNMLASDQIMGDLVAEGLPGESHEIRDGIAWRTEDRAGWSIWRYGVVGANSAATPLGDVDPDGNEWVNFKSFNATAAYLGFGLISDENVETQNAASIAVIDKYAIPLGSGALEPSEYDGFIAELKAVGVDDVIADAMAQYADFMAQ